jgi:two-component system chemotaxis response regulator CheY
VRKTALIVDDSTSMRQLVNYTLAQAGFDVVEGVDGSDALTKLKGAKINVIITDVNMPIMDGITFVKHVRQLPEHRFTPILILTTESQDGKKQEGKAAGATGWLVKPFDPTQMLKTIAKVLP